MTTYFLAIGINHYTDRAFRTLSCCENDATELHSLFKRNLELGDRARKLVGAVSIGDVKNELRRIGQEIRNGDTFVFFFAGHGYQHPKKEDQYLLFPDAEAILVNKGHRDGMLALSALRDLTEHWVGVARVFILDACRSWLPGRGADGASFDNETALAYLTSRSPGFGPESEKPGNATTSSGVALPPVILNATRNGQEAKELEDRQRGILALALEQSLESQQQSGQVIYLGERLLNDVRYRMNNLLQQGRLGVEQEPLLTPASAQVLIYRPSKANQHLESDSPSHLNNNKLTSELDERKWRLACLKNTVTAYEEYLHSAPSCSPYIELAFAKVEHLLTGSPPLLIEATIKPTTKNQITDSEQNNLRLIAEEAAGAVGSNGLIRIIKNSGEHQDPNSLFIKSGAIFDIGSDPKNLEYNNPAIRRLDNHQTLVIEKIPNEICKALIEYVKNLNNPLAIFTRAIDDSCMENIKTLNSRNEISVKIFILANKQTIDWLEDIAILTGATTIFSRSKYAEIINKNYTINGSARVIECDYKSIYIADGDSDIASLQNRSQQLKEYINQAKQNAHNENDVIDLQLRLANISGGTAEISLSDDQELFEDRARFIQKSLTDMQWPGVIQINKFQ